MSYDTVFINRYKGIEEISIRQEVEDFFTGFDFGEAKECAYVVQQIRRNRESNPMHCTKCWDPIRNEGKKGCPNCGDVGYQFDEKLVVGYLTNLQSKRLVQNLTYINESGRSSEVMFLFYTTYKGQLFNGDIILRPLLNNEGFIDYPLTYQEKFIITNAFPYRLDEGRLEFNFYSVMKVK